MLDSLHPRDLGVIVRNTQPEDIPRIVDLQKESFPYLARYGNIWHPEELESHIRIFPQGQFVAVEPDGVGVAGLELHRQDARALVGFVVGFAGGFGEGVFAPR